MSDRVFWNLFTKTGEIGLYLLYKFSDIGFDAENKKKMDDDLYEVARERG
ncbi:MAG: hypothetical protein GX994_01465 [Firmicutes bacterium]|nr:hypothetical protein [Bacillota bacterium]